MTTKCLILVLMIASGLCNTKTRLVNAQDQLSVEEDLSKLLGRCKLLDDEFDSCMKDVFNDLRVYFPTGVPELQIKPFDPHRASFVEIRRGDQKTLAGFKLILRNVTEYGWTRSEVTKYHTDYEQNRIIYSQYFPEKSLEGWYEFTGNIFGNRIKRSGFWNMTLYDYSQTTSVRRLGEPGSILKVRIEIDRIGGLKMHVSNALAPGHAPLDDVSDGLINSAWPIGLPFIKPIINDLISTAFTDIFNESFRYFPIDRFLRYS